MKPLIVLLGVFILSCIVSKLLLHDFDPNFNGRLAMCAMLMFTSVGHFAFTKGMAMMLPKFTPAKRAMIYITGVIEILAGIGLVIRSTYHLTAILLIIFFVLISPANVIGAKQSVNLEKANYEGSGLSYLWFRIPLQVLFIAWIWYFGIFH